ncbi:hypothetical protein Esti_003778 [Eimeria stiedai]
MRFFGVFGFSSASVTALCSAHDLLAMTNDGMADSLEAASQRDDLSSLERPTDEPLSANSSRSENSARMQAALQAFLPATLLANLIFILYLVFKKKEEQPEREAIDGSLRMKPLPTQDVVHISVKDLPQALAEHVFALGGRICFMTSDFVLIFSPDYSQDFETAVMYLDGDDKEAKESIAASLTPLFLEPVAYDEKAVVARVTDDCHFTLKLRFLPKSEFLQEK